MMGCKRLFTCCVAGRMHWQNEMFLVSSNFSFHFYNKTCWSKYRIARVKCEWKWIELGWTEYPKWALSSYISQLRLLHFDFRNIFDVHDSVFCLHGLSSSVGHFVVWFDMSCIRGSVRILSPITDHWCWLGLWRTMTDHPALIIINLSLIILAVTLRPASGDSNQLLLTNLISCHPIYS